MAFGAGKVWLAESPLTSWMTLNWSLIGGCLATTDIRANAPGGFLMAFDGLKAMKGHRAKSRGSQPTRPELVVVR